MSAKFHVKSCKASKETHARVTRKKFSPAFSQLNISGVLQIELKMYILNEK